MTVELDEIKSSDGTVEPSDHIPPAPGSTGDAADTFTPDWLADDLEAVTGQPPDEAARWSVTDEASAEWALTKLAKLRARLADIDRLANSKIAPVEQWRTERRVPLERDVEFFEAMLVRWHRRQVEAGGPKSVVLPSGTVRSRAGQSRVEVVDVDAFVRWADRSGRQDLVRTTVAADRRELKRWPSTSDGQIVDPDTGETVPGVGVVEGVPSFTVKVTGQ